MTRFVEINMYPDDNLQLRLKTGLMRMAPEFYAKLCNVCDGHGAYRQMYTAGCGGGYFHAKGYCDYCNGWGLRMLNGIAPLSTVAQVLTAEEQSR